MYICATKVLTIDALREPGRRLGLQLRARVVGQTGLTVLVNLFLPLHQELHVVATCSTDTNVEIMHGGLGVLMLGETLQRMHIQRYYMWYMYVHLRKTNQTDLGVPFLSSFSASVM